MNSYDTSIRIEPGYYDFGQPTAFLPPVDRRDFFKTLGAGVMVLALAPTAMAQQGESGSGQRRPGGARQGTPGELSAWIHIGEDGAVTVYCGKAEVGQNVRTTVTQACAEELGAPVATIKVILGDTDLVPYDGGTFGSNSTPRMLPIIHRAAAAARGTLLDMAAEHFKVEKSTLTVADGKISRTGGTESVTFGQLTKGQKFTTTIDAAVATPATDWKVCGTSVPKINAREFVTGKHKYTSDIKLPGMLHGKVLRPPTFNAKPTSVDTSAAEAMEGVKVIHDGDFIGAVAPTAMQAEHAINAIKVEWSTESGQPSHKTIFEYLKNNVAAPRAGRGGAAPAADDAAAPAAADQTLKQTYTIAYIAHTPLEPRAAVADWKDDKLTVWAGTQSPFGHRNDLARALSIPAERIRVIVPDTGSAYGGKHTGESSVEAARLSKGAGKPVKLVWTRQEEFTWAYHRPAGVIDIFSGAKSDGTLAFYESTNYQSGPQGQACPYNVPNPKVVFKDTKHPIRIGSYRGLAGPANFFARETHLDELARLLKMDPLEFRLKNLTGEKNGRQRGVFEAAAKAFNWGSVKPAGGRGYGIAGGTEKGSFIATCVEVLADKDSGTVKVVRALTAFDCGAVVNPNHLKSQIEGAMVQSLGGALFEALEFKDGIITNPRLSEYRVPRFSDLPKLEVVLVDNKTAPIAGAGETPMMSMAPAVGNAIFDATAIRLRNMPMIPDGLKA